ncbi:MAG: putative DNA binding domain-containing protein [Porphyromonadaceae bacterium]|nr:putative DNA binding domain-containing protein [Porphyromonadaceae bacterium]
MRKTIEQLKLMKESEHKVEFKKGEGGNIAYNGGGRVEPKDRRKCILGYVTALCNEGGGSLVIGMHDKFPHEVIGTKQAEGAIGKLESDIYNDTGIRTDVYELFDNNKKRVLVIDVVPRPIGRVFKFEDIALMRVGEELKAMSDEVYLKIIQEQEPDFSQQICQGLVIDDLDESAIEIMKDKYSIKQKNPGFKFLSKEQVLTDLDLFKSGNLTNAALILLGKEDVLIEKLPQAAVMLEYRAAESQIHFDNRQKFQQPFFVMVEKIWNLINLRNGSIPVREGVFNTFEIPLFNEEVIREALNNAISHRDYRRQSETIIKQYPLKMSIISAGGFPHGVSIDNLLSVPSTPRNRLLADVLSKTGLVERSGQGIDRIFINTLSEGKPDPDYSRSDDFSVNLTLSAEIEDKAFALFIRSVQDSLPDDNKLSVFDIVTLNEIRKGNKRSFDKNIIDKLKDKKLIEPIGKTKGTTYILCKDYYEFADKKVEYSKLTDWDINQAFTMIQIYLTKHHKAKMGDFVNLFEGHITRRKIKYFVEKMLDADLLKTIGSGSGTRYILSDNHKERIQLINEAVQIGFEELKKRGKIK